MGKWRRARVELISPVFYYYAAAIDRVKNVGIIFFKRYGRRHHHDIGMRADLTFAGKSHIPFYVSPLSVCAPAPSANTESRSDQKHTGRNS